MYKIIKNEPTLILASISAKFRPFSRDLVPRKRQISKATAPADYPSASVVGK